MKRYSIVNYDQKGNATPGRLEESAFGQLVKYDDIAALKEENEVQLLRHEIERNQLKARVAELEGMYKPVYSVASGRYDSYMNELFSITDSPIPMADNFVLYRKEPANEG